MEGRTQFRAQNIYVYQTPGMGSMGENIQR
jgi:hypothetical protein